MSRIETPPDPSGPPADAVRPLRIGMVAPPWYELPPRGYGGIETVVAGLVDRLVARGHEVTLVSSGQHRTAAQRSIRVFDRPPSELIGQPLPELIAAAAAAEALAGCALDVVHDHCFAGPLTARGRTVPTAVTTHGPVVGMEGAYYGHLGATVDLVAISAAQRRSNPALNWAGTVHNALDVRAFPFRERKDDYVLWIGRFSPDKGAHTAIDAARRLGRRIVVVGRSIEGAEQAYFEREVRPRLGADVELLGEVPLDVKAALIGGARCLAFPIEWDEPFGMVMIEALACGTPVAAIPRGSVPEVLRDGVTAAFAAGPDDFADALARAEELDPADCRREAEERFDLTAMAAGYERVYRALADGEAAVRRVADAAD